MLGFVGVAALVYLLLVVLVRLDEPGATLAALVAGAATAALVNALSPSGTAGGSRKARRSEAARADDRVRQARSFMMPFSGIHKHHLPALSDSRTKSKPEQHERRRDYCD